MNKPTTSHEWAEFMAIEIMGWEPRRPGSRIWAEGGGNTRALFNFDPYNNISHAMECLEELNPDYMSIDRNVYNKGIVAYKSWVHMRPGDKFHSSNETHKPAIAICEALWAVYESKEKRK